MEMRQSLTRRSHSEAFVGERERLHRSIPFGADLFGGRRFRSTHDSSRQNKQIALWPIIGNRSVYSAAKISQSN